MENMRKTKAFLDLCDKNDFSRKILRKTEIMAVLKSFIYKAAYIMVLCWKCNLARLFLIARTLRVSF